jgi:hypothetical protein
MTYKPVGVINGRAYVGIIRTSRDYPGNFANARVAIAESSNGVRQPILRHGRKPAYLNRYQIRILRAAEHFASTGERVTQLQIAEYVGKASKPGYGVAHRPTSQGYVAKMLARFETLGLLTLKTKRGRYNGGTRLAYGVQSPTICRASRFAVDKAEATEDLYVGANRNLGRY